MPAPSATLSRAAGSLLPIAVPLPLFEFQLNQMLALTKWASSAWMIGQNQWSRYTTLLTGGAPIGA